MKNRLMMLALFFSMILGCAAETVWAKGAVAHREAHQQKRIAQGVKSGQLTRGEAAHLEHGEQKIEKTREKALSDGTMSKGEKAKLTGMENKESRQIYGRKHNAQKR